MKIAVVSTMNGSPWGGSEELWAAMVRAARREGHPVAVSVLRWPSTPPRVAEVAATGAQVFPRRHPPGRLLGRVARRFAEPDPFGPILAFGAEVVCINQGGTHDVAGMPEVFALVERLQARSIPYVVLCHLDHEYRLPGREVIARTEAVWSRAARVGFVSRRSIELAERQFARRIPNAVLVRNPVNLDAPALLPWPSGDLVRFATVARLDAV